MMRALKKISPAFLLLTVFLLFPSAEAHADPVAVTNGYFTSGAPSPAGSFRTYDYDFRGNNLRLDGSESDGFGQSVGRNCALPCTAGSTFSVTHAAGLRTWLPNTFLQFNGQSYTGWANGTLNFVTGEMVWPPSGASVITLTTHFTMTGSLSFTARDFINNTSETFSVSDVYGAGTATVRLTLSSGIYFLTGVTYNFQPQSSTPTPEPATLVLLGSGLAGLAARRRRRSGRLKTQ